MAPRAPAVAVHSTLSTIAALAALAVGPAAHAVQVCDLDGQPVNPANGYTTQGKTGLMRCREGEGGPVVREQELRNGVFMGLVRYYRDGVLEKEYRVNERGNRDGLAREFAAARGASNTLLREETCRDGTAVGRSRTWHASGALKRVSQHGDDGREQAVAEFTPQGQLQELRCGPKPVLAPDFDDAKACGFGAASSVTFYGTSGAARARVTFDRGERTAAETLAPDGRVQQRLQADARGGSENAFGPDGTKRRETQWVNVAEGGGSRGSDATRPRRVTVLEREYSESGTLVHERRWRPTERGAEPEAERRWYLNGQPRATLEYVEVDGQPARRETAFHDNGRKAFEGTWLVAARGDSRPLGVHRTYDAEGRLRREQHYDARGRIARERELDEGGRVTRDDEVFEDGSRKAYAR